MGLDRLFFLVILLPRKTSGCLLVVPRCGGREAQPEQTATDGARTARNALSLVTLSRCSGLFYFSGAFCLGFLHPAERKCSLRSPCREPAPSTPPTNAHITKMSLPPAYRFREFLDFYPPCGIMKSGNPPFHKRRYPL